MTYRNDIELYRKVAILQQEEQHNKYNHNQKRKHSKVIFDPIKHHISHIDNDKSIGSKMNFQGLPTHILNVQKKYFNKCKSFKKYND